MMVVVVMIILIMMIMMKMMNFIFISWLWTVSLLHHDTNNASQFYFNHAIIILLFFKKGLSEHILLWSITKSSQNRRKSEMLLIKSLCNLQKTSDQQFHITRNSRPWTCISTEIRDGPCLAERDHWITLVVTRSHEKRREIATGQNIYLRVRFD